jgi:hypothetical protein
MTEQGPGTKRRNISVADPDPGSGVLRPLYPVWVKKSRSGSRMNIPDHISESLETIFWVKMLKFFDADPDLGRNLFEPGSWMEKIQIRDEHPGPATLRIPGILTAI